MNCSSASAKMLLFWDQYMDLEIEAAEKENTIASLRKRRDIYTR